MNHHRLLLRSQHHCGPYSFKISFFRNISLKIDSFFIIKTLIYYYPFNPFNLALTLINQQQTFAQIFLAVLKIILIPHFIPNIKCFTDYALFQWRLIKAFCQKCSQIFKLFSNSLFTVNNEDLSLLQILHQHYQEIY